MILEFLPKALSTYKALKAQDSGLAEKAKNIMKDILAHPESGLGSPLQLSGKFSEVWKRSLSFNESIYYIFNTEKVLIIAIEVSVAPATATKQDLSLEAFSEKDYAAVIAQMAANRGRDNEPKVGIFWYNRARNELFGTVSHKVSDYSAANASDGRITCSEMHEDVWKREFRKQKFHSDGSGPYIGAYQDKPRGRIFYNIETDTFEVAVGKWIEEYPQAYPLILEEFNLPEEKTSLKYAIHWDIGMSWR